MKVGIAQLTSTANLQRNGEAAAALVRRAAAQGCEAVFFPEASDYIGGSPEQTVQLARPIAESPFMRELQRAAREAAIHVSVGVHEPTDPPSSRVRNTLLWLDANGDVRNRYQKIHLFDVDVPGGPVLRESNSVERGIRPPQLVHFRHLKIGPQICYDIRFPESALELRARGANVVVFPSAFTVKTGRAHWRVLNRARAIDTQCYVLSAAQVGAHDAQGLRRSYGHAIAVSPWGDVLAESEFDGEDLLVVELDFRELEKVRVNMPLWEQRRQDTCGTADASQWAD